jgi:hypothetical protein
VKTMNLKMMRQRMIILMSRKLKIISLVFISTHDHAHLINHNYYLTKLGLEMRIGIFYIETLNLDAQNRSP